MVLVTVATGFLLGARGASHPSTLLLTLLGTGLVAGGASAWNQYLERVRDLPDAADGEPALAQRAGWRRSRPRPSAGADASLGWRSWSLGVNAASAAAWRWRRSCSTWPSTRR